MALWETKVISRDAGASAGTMASHHADEVLACASFVPSAAFQAAKLSPGIVESLVPLVLELAKLYRVPPPQLDLVNSGPGMWGEACYIPRTHHVILTSCCPPRDVLGVVFHEFNHIGQFKAIIAATLADPVIRTQYQEMGQEFFPGMVAAVQEQQLDQDPLYVAFGRRFAISYQRLQQAQRVESKTVDVDEYLEMRALYRSSFLELTATISELDANLWSRERLHNESLDKIKRLHDQRSSISPWALLASLSNLSTCWLEERRSTFLLREIDSLRKELGRKLQDIEDRLISGQSDPSDLL